MSALILLTPAFCDEFRTMLNKRFMLTPNEVFRGCMDIAIKHKVAKTEVLHASLFLTHMVNRGGLMLSPARAHKNGLKVHRAGADLSQLQNAYAIELSPSGNHRLMNIQKNKDLIARSKGLLAPVNGSERYVSLGCGHTVGWTKAVEAGCITCETELADKAGHLDKAKICRNPVMRQMVEVGWEWTHLPAALDEMFPPFARVAQKALNVANHVSQEVGDVECGCTMAEQMLDSAIADSGSSWKEAILEGVVDSGAPCADWAKHILTYAEKYAGGKGAPMLSFMHDVSQLYKGNASLGHIVWEEIVAAKFWDASCEYPLARNAIALVALTSTVEKGQVYPSIIGKAEVSKATSKARAPIAKQVEETLLDAISICGKLNANPQQTVFVEYTQELGKLFCRMGALITQTQKKYLNGVLFSVDEIREKFLQSMAKRHGQPIKFPKWGGNAVEAASESAESVTSAPTKAMPTISSLQDHNSPEWICKERGITVGTLVLEKGVNAPVHLDRAFKVVSIGAKVELVQASPYWPNPMTTIVDVKEFLTTWSATKMEVPKKAFVGQQTSNTYAKDLMKSKLHTAILESECVNSYTKSLVFWRKPDHVRTSKNLGKGQLVLCPIVPLHNVSYGKATPGSVSIGAIEVEGEEVDFHIMPLVKPSPDSTTGKYSPEDTFQAFWWISTTPEKSKANMVQETKKVRGFEIPVFVNSCDVSTGGQLFKYVAPEKRPSSIVEPKKKARRS